MADQIFKLIKTARKAGWTIDKTKGNHWTFVDNKGVRRATCSESNDHDNRRMLKRDLRKAGLEV